MGSQPVVVAVSGIKNAGKTTFLEEILPLLRGHGLRVGVIKHDGHSFVPDVPGTDSFRLREAGAQAVAVYSAGRWMLVREEPAPLSELISHMSDMQLILLEGQKDSLWPKIELVRAAVSQQSICRPETLLALATDCAVCVPGVPTIALDGYEQAAQLLLRFVSQLTEEPG